ncbi:MAG: hypothetical protein GY771_03250 [bacterium]|nr:hypothetical protein [bacterium]
MANHVIDDSEKPQYLYVMSATTGSFDGEILTLTGVPSVLYFSDRPYRIAGHLSVEKLVELWGNGADYFTANPPNATLSIFSDDGDNNVVIELIGVPDISGESVMFPVKTLLGDLPEVLSASSLFIDMLTSNIKTPGVY